MYIALCQLPAYMSSLLSFFFICNVIYLFYDAFFYFTPLFLDVRFRGLNFTLQLQLFILKANHIVRNLLNISSMLLLFLQLNCGVIISIIIALNKTFYLPIRIKTPAAIARIAIIIAGIGKLTTCISPVKISQMASNIIPILFVNFMLFILFTSPWDKCDS